MRDPRLTTTPGPRVNIFRHLFIPPYTHPQTGVGLKQKKLVSNVLNIWFGGNFYQLLLGVLDHLLLSLSRTTFSNVDLALNTSQPFP